MSDKPERPKDFDTTVHLRLTPEVTDEVDQIVQLLERKREVRRLNDSIGRPLAIRYAIGRCLESLRAELAGG